MELQYISDESGKHTAVVIPIEDWENMLHMNKPLKTLIPKKNKLSDKFQGKLDEKVAEDINHYIYQSRKKWRPI